MTLRLGFVTTFYPPYNFGGDGVAVQRLARGLAKWGCDVTVVHDADAHEVLSPRRLLVRPAPADPFGVKIVTLHSRLPLVNILLTHQFGRPVVNRTRLHRVLDEGAFDAILFNNVSLVGGPGVLAYGGEAARLYVAHEHWLVCPTHTLWRHNREVCDQRECIRCQLHYGRPPQLWRNTDLLSREVDQLDAVIAMSEFSRAKHREFGFAPEMDVLPNFLSDPDPTAQAHLERAPRPHERPYFLFVGRLEAIKGLDEVIDVVAANPVGDLLVIGTGSHGAALRRRAAGNPRIKFLGNLPSETLGPYYRHAVGLIAPSLCYETFGLVLIEAFSQSTPVIARRLGSFPEIVEQSGGGLLFSTPDELLASMLTLLNAPDLRTSMGRTGYQAFVERWSERVVVPQYIDVIERARERRRARRG